MTNYDILKEYEAHKTPVPSYDEWEQLQHWADFTDDYHGLREKLEIAEYENAELKELLKECKPLFFPYVKDMPISRDETLNLLARVNSFIGENEEQ